jgi:proteasome accessory factor A
MMVNPVDYIWVSNIYGVIPDDRVDFQLSQRADHIIKTVASRVRFNRALINPKWETMYSHNGMTRLHLLFGESNQNEFAYALKVGTTSIVLRLLEDGLVPESIAISQPLIALREVSRDPEYKWMVDRMVGGPISAVNLQREYLNLAQVYRGESEQTDWILREWEAILDGLEKDPLGLGDRIDWVSKRSIVDDYRREEGLTWQDDALHSVDLEYHNINPEESLFYAYQDMGLTRRLLSDVDITMAMTDPPANTRAKARAQLVERVIKEKTRFYAFDWNGVAIDRHQYYELADPFETELPAA